MHICILYTLEFFSNFIFIIKRVGPGVVHGWYRLSVRKNRLPRLRAGINTRKINDGFKSDFVIRQILARFR